MTIKTYRFLRKEGTNELIGLPATQSLLERGVPLNVETDVEKMIPGRGLTVDEWAFIQSEAFAISLEAAQRIDRLESQRHYKANLQSKERNNQPLPLP